MQGFDGQYVRYKPRAVGGLGGFEIAPEAGIPRVQRQLMLRICELGWLFRYSTLDMHIALHTPVSAWARHGHLTPHDSVAALCSWQAEGHHGHQ